MSRNACQLFLAVCWFGSASGSVGLPGSCAPPRGLGRVWECALFEVGWGFLSDPPDPIKPPAAPAHLCWAVVCWCAVQGTLPSFQSLVTSPLVFLGVAKSLSISRLFQENLGLLVSSAVLCCLLSTCLSFCCSGFTSLSSWYPGPWGEGAGVALSPPGVPGHGVRAWFEALLCECCESTFLLPPVSSVYCVSFPLKVVVNVS